MESARVMALGIIENVEVKVSNVIGNVRVMALGIIEKVEVIVMVI